MLTNRRQYLAPINNAYAENFNNLDEYKHEKNFKRCLRKLTLENVISAVERAEMIMKTNVENGWKMQNYKGYEYCRENPSLTIFQSVKKILRECGIKAK
jgi:hypothetical protein